MKSAKEDAAAKTIKKKCNFSIKDSCSLVTLYRKYHTTIIGKFSAKNSREAKKIAWENLHTDFLKDGPDFTERSVDNIRDKIENIKSLARKYSNALKYHETGGGPPPDVPSGFVLQMYDIVHGSSGDSLRGIGSGMESSSCSVTGKENQPPSDAGMLPLPSVHSFDTFEVTATTSAAVVQHDSAENNDSVSSVEACSSPIPAKRLRQHETSDQNLTTAMLQQEQWLLVGENRELVAEQRKLTELQTKKTQLEIFKLQLEIQKLQEHGSDHQRSNGNDVIEDDVSLLHMLCDENGRNNAV